MRFVNRDAGNLERVESRSSAVTLLSGQDAGAYAPMNNSSVTHVSAWYIRSGYLPTRTQGSDGVFSLPIALLGTWI